MREGSKSDEKYNTQQQLEKSREKRPQASEDFFFFFFSFHSEGAFSFLITQRNFANHPRLSMRQNTSTHKNV